LTSSASRTLAFSGSLSRSPFSVSSTHQDLWRFRQRFRDSHQGLALIEAQQLVPHGDWQNWCKANVKRSMGDIRKVMRMAGSDDPDGAHEAEKAANRKARAAVKEKVASMRPNAEPEQDTEEEEPEAFARGCGLYGHRRTPPAPLLKKC